MVEVAVIFKRLGVGGGALGLEIRSHGRSCGKRRRLELPCGEGVASNGEDRSQEAFLACFSSLVGGGAEA
jgi:hypothetical protein